MQTRPLCRCDECSVSPVNPFKHTASYCTKIKWSRRRESTISSMSETPKAFYGSCTWSLFRKCSRSFRLCPAHGFTWDANINFRSPFRDRTPLQIAKKDVHSRIRPSIKMTVTASFQNPAVGVCPRTEQISRIRKLAFLLCTNESCQGERS